MARLMLIQQKRFTKEDDEQLLMRLKAKGMKLRDG